MTLQTPFGTIYKGEVRAVRFNTTVGQMEVFSGHASFAGVINFSPVRIRSGQHELIFLVRQGVAFVHLKKNKLHILARDCKKIEEAEYESIEQHLISVQKMLSDGHDELSQYELERLKREAATTDQMLRFVKKR